jgi:hypothetical protein
MRCLVAVWLYDWTVRCHVTKEQAWSSQLPWEPRMSHSSPQRGGYSWQRPQTWKASNQESHFVPCPSSWGTETKVPRFLPSRHLNLLACTTYSTILKMEAISSSETSVYFYQTARHHTPEEIHSHSNRIENLWIQTEKLTVRDYYHAPVIEKLISVQSTFN